MLMLRDMLLVLQYHALVACRLLSRSAGRITHLKHEDLYMD